MFTATQGEDNKPIVRIVCTATFEFKEVLEIDAIPEYFYPNSLAIVFPYVRAFVRLRYASGEYGHSNSYTYTQSYWIAVNPKNKYSLTLIF